MDFQKFLTTSFIYFHRFSRDLFDFGEKIDDPPDFEVVGRTIAGDAKQDVDKKIMHV